MNAARYEDEKEWRLIDETFYLGHTYDPQIVAALRKLDPAVAPLWVIKAYEAPGFNEPQIVGRHLLARYIAEPRVRMKVKDFESIAIWNVTMPSVLPKELAGLPSGPYFPALLLEGESPDGVQPGEYMPMTWDLVKRLEIATQAIKNHTIDQLSAARLRRVRTRKEKAKEQYDNEFRDRFRATRNLARERRGDLIRVKATAGSDMPVSVSSQLMRLRKIAAEGVGV